MNYYHVTVESFGSMCPVNWEEIAYALNAIIDDRGIATNYDAICDLWEDYNNGKLESVPVAVFEN